MLVAAMLVIPRWFSSQHKADALYRGGTAAQRVFDRSEHATTGRYQYLREKQCNMVLVFVILCCLVLREMMVFMVTVVTNTTKSQTLNHQNPSAIEH